MGQAGVAAGLVRSGTCVAPLLGVAGLALRGGEGGVGALAGAVLATGNLVVSATSLEWAAKISTTAVAVVALGGYVVRLILVSAVLLGLRAVIPTFDLVAAALALVVAHLALSVWRARTASLTLAPAPAGPGPAEEVRRVSS